MRLCPHVCRSRTLLFDECVDLRSYTDPVCITNLRYRAEICFAVHGVRCGGQDFDKLCSAVCGYLLLLLPRNVIAKVPDARALRIRSAFAALRSAF